MADNQDESDVVEEYVPPAPGSFIKKNNELVNEWRDTNNKRDKMKMLQISASAEQNKKAF